MPAPMEVHLPVIKYDSYTGFYKKIPEPIGRVVYLNKESAEAWLDEFADAAGTSREFLGTVTFTVES